MAFKLLKYFNGTIISTSFVLPSLRVFPVFYFIFKWFRVLYVIIRNIFIVLPKTSWCFWKIITILNQVIHWHYNIDILRIICVCIVYSAYAFNKWCTIFKYFTLTSFVCSFCGIIISCPCNCYSFLYKYVCICIIT